jgi:alpha-beta hydrolase superfamily lysophospholipase
MHSAMSVNDSKWTELHQKADAVLNVDDICNQGSALGPDVTDVKIYGGMHDLILSEPKVREEVYNSIFEWLHRHL